MEKENVLEKEFKTTLETYDNTDIGFQIVKFEKSFNPKDYPTIETPPKIISSVLLEAMNVKQLSFGERMKALGGISRYFKNDYITLSEEDVINIKTKHDIEIIIPPLNRNNIKQIFATKLQNCTTSNINYNFTFLIELDPLDD